MKVDYSKKLFDFCSIEKGDVLAFKVKIKDEWVSEGDTLHYLIIEDKSIERYTLLNIDSLNIISAVKSETVDGLIKKMNSFWGNRLELSHIIKSRNVELCLSK